MVMKHFKLTRPGEVRVRIAPAPTGPLHLGTARTALFNYLFAQKERGSFILRIEDTDLERSEVKFETDIMESLKWLGVEWDEGPDIGGKYGPYRQSERRDTYAKHTERLLEEGKAYHCFCSKEELEAQRQYQMSMGEAPHYTGKCRELSSEQVGEYLAEKKSSIIRFKVPHKQLKFNDLIREEVEFDVGLMGDIAIAKCTWQESRGEGRLFFMPLYNFAAVVDDFEMQITHVIRGEDHIPNTPKQILLQEALNFPRPSYAHLPLILGPDRSKLSKRHGALALADYRKAGYLAEAVVNFIAFLGWNPGTSREIFSLDSLKKEFSLKQVHKAGAVFNIQKLDWLNGFYLRQKPLDKLTELCLPYLPPENKFDFEHLKKIVAAYQERLKKLSDIDNLTRFFFQETLSYPKELLRWKQMSDQEIEMALESVIKLLSQVEDKNFTKENLENILVPEAEKFGQEITQRQGLKVEIGDRGSLLWPLRAALTGEKASAGPFEIAEILGKQKSLQRLTEAQKILKSP